MRLESEHLDTICTMVKHAIPTNSGTIVADHPVAPPLLWPQQLSHSLLVRVAIYGCVVVCNDVMC